MHQHAGKVIRTHTGSERSTRVRFVCFVAAAVPAFSSAHLIAGDGPGDGFTDASIAKRVEQLISQMTLQEKLGQLTQMPGSEVQDTNPSVKAQREEDLFVQIRDGSAGSFLGAHGAEYTNRLQRVAVEESRLGIPLIFGNDVIHGYRTIFPIPLGEAATWDPKLVQRGARVAATEARAAGTHWTFAPMVDVCRDARWGRIAETSGEDPFLGAAMAAARVRGFQGDDVTAPDAVLACAKHYVAYGAAEAGRDYNTVDISIEALREIHLPTFKAAVDADVGTLMSAFNEINGVPASGNPLTLTRILRDEWGFRGFVVSDWTSIKEMIVHGYAEDLSDAGMKAITAGVDMDMVSEAYRSHFADAIQKGVLSESVIDRSLRPILAAKVRLGLFENPYSDPSLEKKVTLCESHRATARELARKAMVLLKNDGDLLPLSNDVKSIAVIGPLADSHKDPLGTWAAIGRAEDVVTVLDGIKNRCGSNIRVTYAKGCEVQGDSRAGFDEAVQTAQSCDVAVLVVGESEDLSGEAHCRSTLNLPGVQRELVQAVQETGTPVVVVLMNGRPLAVPWLAEHVPAILETWHLGVECGHAVAEVLFGDFNPGGKLPATFPRSVGQVPIYYNHKNTGRPWTEERWTSKYIDLPSTPLYAFGHGLSYTQFAFSDLRISAEKIKSGDCLEVRIDVKNVGKRAGDEVVQLYVRDLVASRTRPVKELKGFERVTLQPSESRTVAFRLCAAQLGFYQAHEYTIEPGAFQLWVGPNSVDGESAHFEIVAGEAAM